MTYVPLLRWKKGELTALRHVRASTKSRIVPFLDISADRFRGKKATKLHPAVAAPQHFVDELSKNWGSRYVYLAAAKVAVGKAGKHPIEDIAAISAAAGIPIIPATELSAPPAYQQSVVNVHKQFASGVCLKVDLQEMTSAQGWASTWQFQPAETDLIVDLADTVGTVQGLGAVVHSAFKTLYAGTSWRSVTIAGTSMPENFSGLAAGKHRIRREEWGLWNSLVASSLPYHLQYGDYATVPLTTPPAGIQWGYPINVRYTLDADFLICRGVKTKGAGAKDMGPQLIDHAKSIVAEPGRNPISGCWADAEIDKIAATGVGQGGLPHWVSLAVNRHLELVDHLLP